MLLSFVEDGTENLEAITIQGSLGFSTNYHRLSSSNNKHLFVTVLEVGKSRIKGSADSIFGKGPLPCLQMASFFLYPYMVEKESISLMFFFFFIRAPISFMRTHFHDLIPLKELTFRYHHNEDWCFNIQIMEGHKYWVHKVNLVAANILRPFSLSVLLLSMAQDHFMMLFFGFIYRSLSITELKGCYYSLNPYKLLDLPFTNKH